MRRQSLQFPLVLAEASFGIARAWWQGRMKKRKAIAVCVLLAGLASVGCAKVPPQAVILSQVVGERLADLQASHESFVSMYFGLTRERIEDFLVQKWVPTFLGEFAQEAQLMEKLETIQVFTEDEQKLLKAELQSAGISENLHGRVLQALNDALGDPERGHVILDFSEEALREIEDKRRSLLDPVSELERKTLEELRKVYAQLRGAQSTVTAHLRSIRRVQAEQDKVFERLGLLRQRDELIEKAIETNQTIMGILDKGKKAKETLKDLENTLKSIRSGFGPS